MLIGSKDINLSDLREASRSVKSLSRFSDGLVPPPFNKVMPIVYNQRYYTALVLRTLKGVELYKHKGIIIEEFLSGVKVNGTLNSVTDINELMSQVDLDILCKALFRDELNAYENWRREQS